MDIVILADFCGSFDENVMSFRFPYIADMLCREHDVEIITSDFDHAEKAFFEHCPEDLPFKVTMLHECGYPKNICIKRFLSHYIFARNLKKYLAGRKKPDVIYAAVPTLFAPYVAARYCEENGVRFIIDIQDLWPEAFRMAFDIPVLSSVLLFPLQYLADGVYRSADAVCAVSGTYISRALSVNEKVSDGHCVFLGTDLSVFDSGFAKQPGLLKAEDELWLGYCGSLSDSYDIPLIIDALAILKEKAVDLPKFVIMGDGYKKEEFASYAKAKGIDALFTGRLSYTDMCSTLSLCDMVVNPIMKGSAASIINKHSDYAASGLPVLNTQDAKEYRELVDEYQMGLNCSNEEPADVAAKLSCLISDPQLRRQMGENARRCAEERFDRRHSYKELINVILNEERDSDKSSDNFS